MHPRGFKPRPVTCPTATPTIRATPRSHDGNLILGIDIDIDRYYLSVQIEYIYNIFNL
jgi:hypothetical protein